MAGEKKILVLGAGLVAAPLVKYLAGRGYKITLANRTFSKAVDMARGMDNVLAVGADILDPETLRELVPDNDVVVSLVPHVHHLIVAKVCLEFKKHMVTTSYVKDDIKVLENQVKAAGLTFLNELGLDPGIDHMSAMKIIDCVKEKGGQILDFSSSTGGLPAPDANDNPLGYKISWSPRGVVLAGTNNGRYLANGEIVDVPSNELFARTRPLHIDVDNLGDFEVYTNRDCIGYIDLYGLDGVENMFRGTIRNLGWCPLWHLLGQTGYLDLTERGDLSDITFAQLYETLRKKAKVEKPFDEKTTDDVLEKMKWLGLFSKQNIPKGTTTYLDALTCLFEDKLKYKKGERDMIVMEHKFRIKYPDRTETLYSTLVDYGIPGGDSSMARTVALPAAIGVDLMLKGKIALTGVLTPTKKEIYEPVLAELEEAGVRFVEKIKTEVL